MILTSYDIFYEPSRDGVSSQWGSSHSFNIVEKPCTPIAFVIDGEVVLANGFSPSIGDNVFLANPTYSSRVEIIDGVETEIVIANVNGAITEMIVNDLFTSVLLSNPIAVPITRGSLVNVGWKYDENGFFLIESSNNVKRRIDENGIVVL